jgi:hypothetical protein
MLLCDAFNGDQRMTVIVIQEDFLTTSRQIRLNCHHLGSGWIPSAHC